MPLCVQCPASYPREAFRLVDREGTELSAPKTTVRERLLRLLEHTPLLRQRGSNRRARNALALRRLCELARTAGTSRRRLRE